MEYNNRLILAPMVRIGTLPMRLLSLDYGADIVYCEEIIDYKFLKCRRVENNVLGTIDFKMDDGTIVFRTCEKEREKVVFQMGTCSVDRAVQVAQMIEHDVAAIDVNMGCPKEFSIKGGMGAALLCKPDLIAEILTGLVRNVKVPVTCKIRLLTTTWETVQLAKLIESCGVSAIAVHGRMRDERPQHNNHDDIIAAVAAAVHIPVIANGGSGVIRCHDDIRSFQRATGCSSVMLARAAQWNPSIFSREGLQPLTRVIPAFIRYAVLYDSPLSNVKYCIQQMMHECLETGVGRRLLSAVALRDVCDIWDMTYFYDVTVGNRERRAQQLTTVDNCPCSVTLTADGVELVQMPCQYDRKTMCGRKSAKLILHELSVQMRKCRPQYNTVSNASTRLFHTTVHYDGRLYSSAYWEKSKKWSQQVAAMVCLKWLQVDASSGGSKLAASSNCDKSFIADRVDILDYQHCSSRDPDSDDCPSSCQESKRLKLQLRLPNSSCTSLQSSVVSEVTDHDNAVVSEILFTRYTYRDGDSCKECV